MIERDASLPFMMSYGKPARSDMKASENNLCGYQKRVLADDNA